MGVIIPVVLLVITYILERTGMIKEINYASLFKAFIVYVIGSLRACLLLMYKGVIAIQALFNA